MCGAFADESSLRRAGERLAGADTESLKTTCRQVLGCHTSTAERLPFMDRLYADLFSRIPPPTSVLDLCAGLQPFAIPWMTLAPGCRYEAWDIDTRTIELVNRFFSAHVPGATAVAQDLLADTAPLEADLVILLKSLTTLEHQEKGAGRAVLARIRARHVLVSFPATSLGGRDVGMRQNYADSWEPVMKELNFSLEMSEYPNEVLYLLTRHGEKWGHT